MVFGLSFHVLLNGYETSRESEVESRGFGGQSARRIGAGVDVPLQARRRNSSTLSFALSLTSQGPFEVLSFFC